MASDSQFKNNYFTEMCSGSEAGSYLRLIDFGLVSVLVLVLFLALPQSIWAPDETYLDQDLFRSGLMKHIYTYLDQD